MVRYDVVVDVVPEVKWIPEDGYKNLKIVVEIDKEIDAQAAAEQELRRRHKALGSLKIVIDRGLQVNTSRNWQSHNKIAIFCQIRIPAFSFINSYCTIVVSFWMSVFKSWFCFYQAHHCGDFFIHFLSD